MSGLPSVEVVLAVDVQAGAVVRTHRGDGLRCHRRPVSGPAVGRDRGLIDGTQDLTQTRTAGFTVLVFCQLFNCFNARSETTSAFSLRRSPARLQ
jgi:magnesium-transporting ATPase (P-type)